MGSAAGSPRAEACWPWLPLRSSTASSQKIGAAVETNMALTMGGLDNAPLQSLRTSSSGGADGVRTMPDMDYSNSDRSLSTSSRSSRFKAKPSADPDQSPQSAQAAVAGAGTEPFAPSTEYVQTDEFHFLVMPGQHLDVKDASRGVVADLSSNMTVVTSEVMQLSMSCNFFVKLVPGSSEVRVGFTDGNMPNDFYEFLSNAIGSEQIARSTGAILGKTPGVVVHKGKVIGSAPPIRDGDVAELQFCHGSLCFMLHGELFYQCTVTYPVRFAVTLKSKGQSAHIVSSRSSAESIAEPAAGAKQAEVLHASHDFKMRVSANTTPGPETPPATQELGLKYGWTVRLPDASDPRLDGMRVGMNASAKAQCGKLGVVTQCNRQSIQVRVGGSAEQSRWDLEVFSTINKRFCYHGCEMQEEGVTGNSRACGVCLTRQPVGCTTLRCDGHDYDVCAYCCGLSLAPGVGSRVIRGPTWKGKDEDGQPYEEGVVTEDLSADGQIIVKWDATGRSGKYRGPPFQDVMLAHENGLRSKEASDDSDHDTTHDGLGGLLRQFLKQHQEADRGPDALRALLSEAASSETPVAAAPDTKVELVGDAKCLPRASKVFSSKLCGGSSNFRPFQGRSFALNGADDSGVAKAPFSGIFFPLAVATEVASCPGQQQAREAVGTTANAAAAATTAVPTSVSTADDDHVELPRLTVQKGCGFHFWPKCANSIMLDDTKKVAQCNLKRDATVFTEEVFHADGAHEFVVKAWCAQGRGGVKGAIGVGIVDDKPRGWGSYCIGHSRFEGTIGALCLRDGGAIVHKGEISGEAPGWRDGEVLTVRVLDGTAEFLKDGVSFHSFGLRGYFRFGVSLSVPGQCVEIMPDPSVRPVQALEAAVIDTDILQVRIGQEVKLDMDSKLGAGSFGTTFSARLQQQAGFEDVAVKILHADSLQEKVKRNFYREIQALAALALPGQEAHPHLVKLIAVDPERFAIVMELCNSDLAGHLQCNYGRMLYPFDHAKLMKDVAVGCAWLAEKQFVHRDLKMQNVLIAAGPSGVSTAKVADFGLARPTAEKLQPAGTLLYMAPECFDAHFSEKSDVYSFAFIMLGTFTEVKVTESHFLESSDLSSAFEGISDKAWQQLFRRLVDREQHRPRLPEDMRPDVKGWIQAAWHHEPPQRPTFHQLCINFKQLLTAVGNKKEADIVPQHINPCVPRQPQMACGTRPTMGSAASVSTLVCGGLIFHGASMPIGDVALGVGSENFDASTAATVQKVAERNGETCVRDAAVLGMHRLRHNLKQHKPLWVLIQGHASKCCKQWYVVDPCHSHCGAPQDWRQLRDEIFEHTRHMNGRRKLNFVIVCTCYGSEFAQLLSEIGLDAIAWSGRVGGMEADKFVRTFFDHYYRNVSQGCSAAFDAAVKEAKVDAASLPKLYHRQLVLLGAAADGDAVDMLEQEGVYTNLSKSFTWRDHLAKARDCLMKVVVLVAPPLQVQDDLPDDVSRWVASELEAVILIGSARSSLVERLTALGAELVISWASEDVDSVALALNSCLMKYVAATRSGGEAEGLKNLQDSIRSLPADVQPEAAGFGLHHGFRRDCHMPYEVAWACDHTKVRQDDNRLAKEFIAAADTLACSFVSPARFSFPTSASTGQESASTCGAGADDHGSGEWLVMTTPAGCKLRIPPATARQVDQDGNRLQFWIKDVDPHLHPGFAPLVDCGPSGIHFVVPVQVELPIPKGVCIKELKGVSKEEGKDFAEKGDVDVDFTESTSIIYMEHFTLVGLKFSRDWWDCNLSAWIRQSELSDGPLQHWVRLLISPRLCDKSMCSDCSFMAQRLSDLVSELEMEGFRSCRDFCECLRVKDGAKLVLPDQSSPRLEVSLTKGRGCFLYDAGHYPISSQGRNFARLRFDVLCDGQCEKHSAIELRSFMELQMVPNFLPKQLGCQRPCCSALIYEGACNKKFDVLNQVGHDATTIRKLNENKRCSFHTARAFSDQPCLVSNLNKCRPEGLVILGHGSDDDETVLVWCEHHGTAPQSWSNTNEQVWKHLQDCKGRDRLQFLLIGACFGWEMARLTSDLGRDAIAWPGDVSADEVRDFTVTFFEYFSQVPSAGCCVAFVAAKKKLHLTKDAPPFFCKRKVLLLQSFGDSAASFACTGTADDIFILDSLEPKDGSTLQEEAEIRGIRMVVLVGAPRQSALFSNWRACSSVEAVVLINCERLPDLHRLEGTKVVRRKENDLNDVGQFLAKCVCELRKSGPLSHDLFHSTSCSIRSRGKTAQHTGQEGAPSDSCRIG